MTANVEHVRAVVRDRLQGLQRAIDENEADIERIRADLKDKEQFVASQHLELMQLKQWLIANGAEDVNVK